MKVGKITVKEAAEKTQKLTEEVLSSIKESVVGNQIVIRKMLICLLAGGHVLLEDVPGIGKTTVARALARAVGLDFQRIQFTPDLMPSDVTGFNIYNPKTSEFVFREGAAMTQILLADEINRSSPRTQSALLEAMEEGQVTVEGKTYILPQPFMVMATQNPVEHVGTYPLPEAQMDRFMMRLSIGYPSKEEEMLIMDKDALKHLSETVRVVADGNEIRQIRESVEDVTASDEVKHYLLSLTRGSRESEWVELGVSPRASIMLLKAASTLALMEGRTYVKPDDIQRMAHDVLDHRMIMKAQARGQGMTSADVTDRLLKEMVAPR